VRVRINLFEGIELIRQFRDAFVSATNLLPERIDCLSWILKRFPGPQGDGRIGLTLLAQSCAHQPFHDR
jgi:hypothetical protein